MTDTGFKAGTEAAAQWHLDQADAWSASGNPPQAALHRAYAKEIRSLPLPAPSPSVPGETAPASCPACRDETDCSNVRTCNAVEAAYAAKAVPGEREKLAERLAEKKAGHRNFPSLGAEVNLGWVSVEDRDLIVSRLRSQDRKDV